MAFSPFSFVRRSAGFLSGRYDAFSVRRDKISHGLVKAQRSRSTHATYALIGAFALGLCLMGAGSLGQPLFSAAIRGYMRYGQRGGPQTRTTVSRDQDRYCERRGITKPPSGARFSPLCA